MVKKVEFFWNTIASIIVSLLNAILLMFCTRINGIEIAGMFSIAFATSLILNGIGDYGIRIFQVTDTTRKYKFGEYIVLRIVVVAIMLCIGIAFVVITGYELEKMLICIILILFRVVDNLSETYQGELQLQGRLDLAAMSVVIRNIIAIISFLIADLITKNVIIATIALFTGNTLLFVMFDLQIIKKYNKERPIFNKKSILLLLKECFPVCLSTILSLYITNSVKYAIDMYGDYNMQTFYNIIYLPTFTINLASLFVIKPMLKTFGEYWNNKKIKDLTIKILQVIGLIVIVTFIVELICMFVAIPILKVLYGVELEPYKMDLIILVLSGGFYAISILMLYISTAIRKQKLTTLVYLIVTVLAFITTKIFVENYGMRGATISNDIITFVLAVLLSSIYVKQVFKQNK